MNENKPERATRPRMTIDVLADYLNNAYPYKRPETMPADALQAADWWLRHQAPPRDNEAPRRIETRDGPMWNTPYTDRVLYTFVLFFKLRPVDQAIVIGAAEDGVFWRGDDMHLFYHHPRSVYNETLRMRKVGISQYKQEAKNLLPFV